MKITVKELKEHLNGKPIVVETLKAGDIKKKLNEMRGFGFGEGFKSEGEVYEVVDAEEVESKDKKKKEKEENPKNERKINSRGGFGFGEGFKLTESYLNSLTKSEAIELIENIVKNLKGNNEYTNLAFVDRIGSKYKMNEEHITEMKGILREEYSTENANKLYNYITECGCPFAQKKFGGYQGLSQPYAKMMPQIKKTFNTNRNTMDVNGALDATAKTLKLPWDMVEEMYEMQKEAYSLRMEGGTVDKGEVEGKMEECYERYQNMGEGNMDGMYDEMAEMMDYPMAEDNVRDARYGHPDDELSNYEKVMRLKSYDPTEDDWYHDYDEEDDDMELKFNFDDDDEAEISIGETHSPQDNLYTQSDEELVFELEDEDEGVPRFKNRYQRVLRKDKESPKSDIGSRGVVQYDIEDDPSYDFSDIDIEDDLGLDDGLPEPEESAYNFDNIYNEMDEMLKEITGEVEDNEVFADGSYYRIKQKGDNTFIVDEEGWGDVTEVTYVNGELEGAGSEFLPAEVRQYIIDKVTGGEDTDVIGGEVEEALDPVGQDDGDVNNDGKRDEQDTYLLNRRKAIKSSKLKDKKK